MAGKISMPFGINTSKLFGSIIWELIAAFFPTFFLPNTRHIGQLMLPYVPIFFVYQITL